MCSWPGGGGFSFDRRVRTLDSIQLNPERVCRASAARLLCTRIRISHRLVFRAVRCSGFTGLGFSGFHGFSAKGLGGSGFG